MPFCHQCGAGVTGDSEDRYCGFCGADQIGVVAVAAPALATLFVDSAIDTAGARAGGRNDGDGGGLEGGDGTTLFRVATYAAGVALLCVAAWLGDFAGAMFALPLITAAVVAIAQPEPVPQWTERLDDWVRAKHSALQTRHGRLSRWLIRPYLGGLRRIAMWTAAIDNGFTRSGVRVASYLYFSWLFLAVVYFAAIVALTIVVVVIAIMVGLWILSEYSSYQSGSEGYARSRPSQMRFRKGEKFTVRQREPGLLESILGSKTGSEIVAENGKIVGTIQKEDPGLWGSLTGENAKEVIRTREGTKVATFDREQPGVVGSLLGERGKTVLSGADGGKVGEFGRVEPGLIGSLFGEGPRTVIRGRDGKEVAEVGDEEPGFLGSLIGEKPKRVVKVTRDTSDD